MHSRHSIMFRLMYKNGLRPERWGTAVVAGDQKIFEFFLACKWQLSAFLCIMPIVAGS